MSSEYVSEASFHIISPNKKIFFKTFSKTNFNQFSVIAFRILYLLDIFKVLTSYKLLYTETSPT